MRTRRGFMIVLVLATLSLVAVAVVVLAAISGEIRFDAERDRATALERNAAASALGWAKLHPQDANSIDLPAGDLLGPGGALSVSRDPNSALLVHIRCRVGPIAADQTRRYAARE